MERTRRTKRTERTEARRRRELGRGNWEEGSGKREVGRGELGRGNWDVGREAVEGSGRCSG